jgi:FkbM family methyltransferase
MQRPTLLQEARFRAACGYLRLYDVIKDRWDINLRGAGFALRQIGHDRVLDVQGRRLYFDARIAPAYARLIIGRWEELETHFLLRAALDVVDDALFVDVGANVGSVIIDVATDPRIREVVALEPHPVCAEVCRRTARINGWNHVHVIEAAAAEHNGRISFAVDPRNPGSSSLSPSGDAAVKALTLDDALGDRDGPALVLIDVEGAEPRVLRGGLSFIRRTRPLIIFEYNDLSRQHFRLQDIRDLLGEDFEIFRLRQDGYLDLDVERSWNAVAVHRDSVFEPVCAALRV